MAVKPVKMEYTYPHKYDIGQFVTIKSRFDDCYDVRIITRVGLATGYVIPQYDVYHSGSVSNERVYEDQITRLLKGPTGGDPYEVSHNPKLWGKNLQGTEHDPINHPSHYTSSEAKCSACGHPIECIDITRHMGFDIGNAIKYLWRQGLKGKSVEDMKKSLWYINDAIDQEEKK